MTKSQAKEVIDMMFKDKTDMPKDDVFKIIDMIDESVTIRTVEYPSYPLNIPNPNPWWYTVTCGVSEPKVTIN